MQNLVISLIKLIKNITAKQIFYGIVSLFILGIILNYISPYNFFYLHQISLLSIITISLFAVKNFLNQFHIVNSIPSIKTKISGKIIDKYYKKTESYFIGYFIFAISIVFIAGVINLEYVQKQNITGIYGLCLMLLSIITSITGYSYYLIILLLLKDLSQQDLEVDSYVNYIPSSTQWISKLNAIIEDLNDAFILLGIMFTIQYAALIPENFINIESQLTLATPNNEIFIFSWIVIFIFIIVGFPFLTYLQKTYYRKIIINMKNKQISDLGKTAYYVMSTTYGHASADNVAREKVDYVELCIKLIKEIKDSEEDSLKGSAIYKILSFIIMFLIHVSTFLINATDLLSKLKT